MKTVKPVAAVALLIIALIFYTTGTRRCGNVYTGQDPQVVLPRGDTVPALDADGDTTRYQFKCVSGANDVPFKVFAVICLVAALGIAYTAVKERDV